MTTELQTAEAPSRKLPTLTLDPSRDHSTVHGDRTPEDPHYGIAFWQDGFPFALDGSLFPDSGKRQPWSGHDAEGKPVQFRPPWTDAMAKRLEGRLERMARFVPEDEPEQVDEFSSPAAREKLAMEVNLAAWLRGQLRYEPWLVQLAAKMRYGKVHARQKDLVIDLVLDEKLVPEEQVGPALRHYLDGFGPADPSLKH
jgi:hypothetical protein